MSTVSEDQQIQQDVVPLIDNLLKKLQVKNNFLKIVPASDTHNILGKLYDVKIKGTNTLNEQIELSLIVKLAPYQTVYRKQFAIRSLYKNETFAYNNILPEFIKFQEEKNIPPFKPFATCYQATLNELKESIILENLVTQEFRIGNHREPVNRPVAMFLMKHLGKLHALSYAMRDQKPDVFNTLTKNYTNSCFLDPHFLKQIIDMFRSISNQVINIFNSSSNDKHVLKTLQKYVDNGPDLFVSILKLSFEKYGVLNHGDFQLRNLFFKYEDSSLEKPVELCLIDWQLVQYKSPAYDLLFFTSVSTDKNFRDCHYKELLRTYYESLSLYLNKLGTSADKQIPFDVLSDDMKALAPFILCIGILLISQNFQETESIQTSSNQATSKDIVDAFSPSLDFKCALRIKELVSDFMEYGYI